MRCTRRSIRSACGGMTCYLEDAAAGEALTPAFAETVMDSCPDVQAAMPVKYQTGSYQNGFHSGSALLFGVNEQMGQVLDVELLAGRLFTAGEASGMVRRVVVSQSLAEQLYGRTNVTGQQLYLTVAGQEQIFEIIGVIRDQTQLLSGIAGSAVPTVIYLPYALLADANQAADQVLLSCTGDTETVKRQLSAVAQGPLGLRSTIGVQNLSGYLSTVDDLAQKAVWVFLLVAGISMVVRAGGCGGRHAVGGTSTCGRRSGSTGPSAHGRQMCSGCSSCRRRSSARWARPAV